MDKENIQQVEHTKQIEIDIQILLDDLLIYFNNQVSISYNRECELNFRDRIKKAKKVMVISKEEADHLLNFFYADGFISRENHQPVHDFISRLENYLNKD